jgi:nitrate reductase NapE component
VGTQRGIVVSEGGPRASKVFVNDDPRLCAAVAWWQELARASFVLLAPFAALGAGAAWLGDASPAAYLAWLAAAAVGGVLLHVLRTVGLRRRVVYRPAALEAEVAPAIRLSRIRLAALLVARIWPVVAVLLVAGGGHDGARFAVALAWAPAMVAAWTAASAASVVASASRWERERGLRLLFPAGLRQRAAEPYVLYTAPR